MYAPHPVGTVGTALCDDYIIPCSSPTPILSNSGGRSMTGGIMMVESGKPRCHPSKSERGTPTGQGCRPVSPVQQLYPVRNACSPVYLKERMNSSGNNNMGIGGRVTSNKNGRNSTKSKIQKFFDSIKKIFTRSKSSKEENKSTRDGGKQNKVFPELNGAREEKAKDTVDFRITAYNVKRNQVTNELQVEPSKVLKIAGNTTDNTKGIVLSALNYENSLCHPAMESSANSVTNVHDSKPVAIGNYKLGEIIGTGSFSKVRLATSGEEKVAIKMIKIDAIQESRKLVDSIEREISILKSLDHPNIVKYISNVTTNNQVCIITEFIEGMELFQFVVKQKRLSEEVTRTIFYSLVKVIGYMHENGIAHRDLKLENVMIQTDSLSTPSKYLVKLIDFGLAHRFTNSHLLSTRCGSEEYAAPEIIRGNKYCGMKSDVWSLGIILYACLCGNLPFNPDSSGSKSLFDKICKCEIKFPAYLSSSARSLLTKLLTVDPIKRPDISTILTHSFFLVNK